MSEAMHMKQPWLATLPQEVFLHTLHFLDAPSLNNILSLSGSLNRLAVSREARASVCATPPTLSVWLSQYIWDRLEMGLHPLPQPLAYALHQIIPDSRLDAPLAPAPYTNPVY